MELIPEQMQQTHQYKPKANPTRINIGEITTVLHIIVLQSIAIKRKTHRIAAISRFVFSKFHVL